jgi:hypothetical protein
MSEAAFVNLFTAIRILLVEKRFGIGYTLNCGNRHLPGADPRPDRPRSDRGHPVNRILPLTGRRDG